MWARWLPTAGGWGPSSPTTTEVPADLLTITVSLVRDEDIVDDGRHPRSSYDGDLQVLSVGRIDREKNPLLLAEGAGASCARTGPALADGDLRRRDAARAA